MSISFEHLLIVGISLVGVFSIWRYRRLPTPPAMRAWPFPAGLYLFAICALWVLGAIFVGVFATGPLASGRSPVVALLITGYAQHISGFLAAALAYRHVRRLSPPAAAHAPIAAKKILPAALLTYCVALPLTLLATLLWSNLLAKFHVHAPPQDMLDYIRQANSPGLLVALLVLPVIVAPLSEELVFRGGVYRILLHHAPRWVALIVSGLLFALVHGYTFTLVPLTVLGIVLAYAYERTGRIAVPILVHALFNLTSVLNLLYGATP